MGLILLAQFSSHIDNLTSGSAEERWMSRDILIAVSAGLGVTVLLVIWAVFIRKPRDDRDEDPTPVSAPPEDRERRRVRKRRRRRDHRPRNPSLHQTGGLPPPRPEEKPPSH